MTHRDARTQEQATAAGADAVKRTVLRAVAAWIALPLFFVVTSGSLTWWAAWAYCAILLVPMTAFFVLMARRDPQFLDRRMQMREKEREQRRILAWGYPILLTALIVPGLDRRFGWSAVPPVAAAAGMLLALAGYLGVLRTFLENRWAGRTIEHYEGQTLIATGPYAVVRHPMYAASTILYIATPVALGSWWAVIPALFVLPLYACRIRHEEAFLVCHLAGYDDYRRRVRYRLVPLVW